MLSTLIWLVVTLLVIGAIYWIITLLAPAGVVVRVAGIVCGLFALIAIIYALTSLIGSGTSVGALAALGALA